MVALRKNSLDIEKIRQPIKKVHNVLKVDSDQNGGGVFEDSSKTTKILSIRFTKSSHLSLKER